MNVVIHKGIWVDCVPNVQRIGGLDGMLNNYSSWPYSDSLELELRLKVAVKFYVPKRFYSNDVDVRLELIIRVRTEQNR